MTDSSADSPPEDEASAPSPNGAESSSGHRVGRWLAAAVLAGAALFVTNGTTGFLTKIWDSIRGVQPVSASMIEDPMYVDCQPYVTDRAPESVPVPDIEDDDRETEIEQWRREVDPVLGGHVTYRLTLQGVSEQTVVLQKLRVVVDSRKGALKGATLQVSGCGGAPTKRYFEIDLDEGAPKAKAVAGEEEAVEFPYTVSGSDVEVFELNVRTTEDRVNWHLELDYTVNGKAGKLAIKDTSGRSFDLTPKGEAHFVEGGRWVPIGVS